MSQRNEKREALLSKVRNLPHSPGVYRFQNKDGKIICRSIKRLEAITQKTLWLRFDDMNMYRDTIKAITPVIKESPGETKVMAFLKDTRRKNDFGNGYNMKLNDESLYKFREILGNDNVKVVKSLLKF